MNRRDNITESAGHEGGRTEGDMTGRSTADGNMPERERRLAELRTAKYADLLLDYIAKRVLGAEKNSDLLISLINSLLPTDRMVTQVQYINNEIVPDDEDGKQFRLDLRCRTEDGTQFIVEIQNYMQEAFFRRCVAYAAASFSETVRKGGEYDELTPVYLIALMSENATRGASAHMNANDGQVVFRYTMQEKDTGEVPCETIMCIFVELGRFTKQLGECVSIQDKWFYCLKNSTRMDGLPEGFRNGVFEKLFSQLNISKFDRKTMDKYFRLKMMQLDRIDQIKTATNIGLRQGREEGMQKGREEGREEERMEIARSMKVDGMDIGIIAKHTGLSIEQVERL